jgi:glycosyltransferase involved in cell wall biosynthesis
MKKVLIFSLAYFPKHVGGAEVAIKEITDRIDPQDIEFHMVCLRFDSTLPAVEQVGNVLVHRIGFTTKNPSMGDLKKYPLALNKYLFQFLAAWKAARLHARYQYDGTWAMMAHSCGVPAAIFKLFYPQVPYILTLQEGDPPEYIERLARPLWLLFVRAFTTANTVQAISHFLAAWAKRMGYQGTPVVVPNAVDTAHFSQYVSPEELSIIQEEIGKRTGEVWMVTTSRLVHKNAVDDVIRSLRFLPSTIHFLVFGIGPDEEQLRKLAQEEGVYDRVHFRGQIGHQDMPKYLKACDIFIRPSRSEGMGNSFVEAMAAELPVIATQEGGIADFLFDRVQNPDRTPTGWAVQKDNPQEIALAVEDILRDPGETAKVVATAKALAFQKYDWNLIAADMRSHVFGPTLSV